MAIADRRVQFQFHCSVDIVRMWRQYSLPEPQAGPRLLRLRWYHQAAIQAPYYVSIDDQAAAVPRRWLACSATAFAAVTASGSGKQDGTSSSPAGPGLEDCSPGRGVTGWRPGLASKAYVPVRSASSTINADVPGFWPHWRSTLTGPRCFPGWTPQTPGIATSSRPRTLYQDET